MHDCKIPVLVLHAGAEFFAQRRFGLSDLKGRSLVHFKGNMFQSHGHFRAALKNLRDPETPDR
jgi:hypothetical protein